MRLHRAGVRPVQPLLAALAMMIVLAPAAAVASTRKATEERLTCQCGCGLTVHTCNHLQCSFAVPVREDIATSLAAGQSTEAIIGRYVEEYGEKVLSSPTTEGFNLLAWWGPYIALAFGCGVLLIVFRRLRSAAKLEPAVVTAAGTAVTSAARARLERELEELDS